MTRRNESGIDQGFTLVELLIVSIVLPVVIGAISLGLLTIFQVQPGVTDRMATTGDSQVVSANFFRDIQNATDINVQSFPTTYKCGTTSELLGVYWPESSSSQFMNVVSYSLVSNGSTDNLVRNVCDHVGTELSTAASEVPTSTSIISFNVQSSLAATLTPSSFQSAAAAGWTLTTGLTNVQLTVIENVVNHPSDDYTYTLAAAPRDWGQLGGSSGSLTTPLELLGPATPLLGTCSGANASVNVNGAILLSNGGTIVAPKPNVNTSLIYYYGSPPSTTNVVGPPITTSLATPYVDPYVNLTPPDPATLNQNQSQGQPGVWTTTISSGNLAPGIYYFEGSGAGISLQNSTITGSDVLLYFIDGASLSMGPHSNLDVTPMTSGPYANLLIWQDKTDTATMSLQGNADLSGLPGVLYAPGADINLGGTPNFFADNVLADSVSCNGTGSYNIGYTQVPTVPQTITFTSTVPNNPKVGHTYQVAASSTGPSSNAISYSIDSTSTSGACSISGTTVTFTGPGSCVVNANQVGVLAGGVQYYAALEVQQKINGVSN